VFFLANVESVGGQRIGKGVLHLFSQCFSHLFSLLKGVGRTEN